MSKTNVMAALLLSAAGLVAQDTPKPAQELTLSFGVYTSDKASSMFRKFAPLARRVEKSLEKKLGRPGRINFTIFKTYQEARDSLVAGNVDFVRFGPASYVLAKAANPGIQLLAMESKGGKKTFEGYIVVPTDSPAHKLADLRGKRFAFGDRDSTIGRYLVQQLLLEAGMKIGDLGAHEYLGRHDKVFRAVEVGDFDAGALKSGTYRKLNKHHKLRILSRFDNVTKPWVARAGLPENVFGALQQALFDLPPDVLLVPLKANALVAGTDAEYQAVRVAIEAARRFDPPVAHPGKD